jgi:hypothetical protein
MALVGLALPPQNRDEQLILLRLFALPLDQHGQVLNIVSVYALMVLQKYFYAHVDYAQTDTTNKHNT